MLLPAAMQRVFFDVNAGTYESGYLLWFDKSRDDLAGITEPLREGLQVVIYDSDGELEFVAWLARDDQFDCWRAMPIGDEDGLARLQQAHGQ